MTGNGGGFDGGGLFLATTGIVDLPDSLVSGNVAALRDGGGIFLKGGTRTLDTSLVKGNKAAVLDGGLRKGAGTTFTNTGATISGNTAPTDPDVSPERLHGRNSVSGKREPGRCYRSGEGLGRSGRCGSRASTAEKAVELCACEQGVGR